MYEAIRQYLEEGTYPPGTSAASKRDTRRKAKNNFKLRQDGVLLYAKKCKRGDSNEKNWREVIETEQQRTEILQGLHSSSLGGHLGIVKTTEKISSRFYWNNMTSDIQNFIRSCEECQLVNAPTKTAKASLHPIPVNVPEPWYQIGIDLIGPMPVTRDNFKYICTITDYFSKWPEAEPIKQKTAEEVAKVLYLRIMCRHGSPSVIISDQGREFCNKIVEKLLHDMSTVHKVTSPYHPQTNGQTERFNKTLESMLLKFCSEHPHDWNVYLESNLYAYRTTVHASTKYTPFYLLYGREARLIEEIATPSKAVVADKAEAPLPPQPTSEDYAARARSLTEFREDIGKDVIQNIAKAQARQKIAFDKRHHPKQPYKVGDLVLKKNDRKFDRKGGKFEKPWLGPYTIDEVKDNGVCRVTCVKTKRALKQLVNVKKLKKYHSPETGENDQEDTSMTEPMPSTSSGSTMSTAIVDYEMSDEDTD